MTASTNHVLYLDDETINLDVFKLNFSSAYTCHAAENIVEAEDLLRSQPIKVLLTDQRMPDATGTEFINQIKQEFPDVVCIIISGYADKEVLFKAINEVDIFWFIEKPWQKEELKVIIENAIEKFDSLQEKRSLDQQLQDALQQVKRSDRLKTEFLDNISHEIRTPINGITGFTGLVKDGSLSPDELHSYLDIINQSAIRLLEVVENIIEASILQSGNIKVSHQHIYLNDLLDELYLHFKEELREKPEIELRVNKRQGNQGIPITTDREKLFHIFTQLLRNAVKFTTHGYIEFGLYDKERLILYVKDTGQGISGSDQQYVYDTFRQGENKRYTREHDGVGLGLSIVTGLLSVLGGRIWFDTIENQGSTFYFQLPREKYTENDANE